MKQKKLLRSLYVLSASLLAPIILHGMITNTPQQLPATTENGGQCVFSDCKGEQLQKWEDVTATADARSLDEVYRRARREIIDLRPGSRWISRGRMVSGHVVDHFQDHFLPNYEVIGVFYHKAKELLEKPIEPRLSTEASSVLAQVYNQLEDWFISLSQSIPDCFIAQLREKIESDLAFETEEQRKYTQSLQVLDTLIVDDDERTRKEATPLDSAAPITTEKNIPIDSISQGQLPLPQQTGTTLISPDSPLYKILQEQAVELPEIPVQR